VLQGDATDEKLLEDENVDQMDLFISLTNDDENNIMSALLAKRMGAKRVVSLINRRAYAELVQGGQIDVAISPAQTSIGTLLAHVRRGDVAAVHSLRRGAAEALELVVHGDEKSSQVVGRRIEQLPVIKGATIGAIVRGLPGTGEAEPGGRGKGTRPVRVIMAHHDTVIEAGDHVIVFVVSKSLVPRVEKLFQVGFAFL
jgi:trk system potassium uptake protein TrkA